MNEEQLRKALHDASGEVRPQREMLHRAQLQAAHRRRRRDTATAAVGGALLTAVVLVGIGPLGGSNDPTSPPGSPGTTEVQLATRLEATEPVGRTEQTTQRPSLLVGAAASGRLVMIDPVTGKTKRLLAKLDEGTLAGGLSLSPSSDRLYFDVRGEDTCQSEIRSISTSGGEVTVVADGANPALAQDGRLLALSRRRGCGAAAAVVVRDISSGTERVVADGATIGASDVAALSWSANGRQLLIDFRFDNGRPNRLTVVEADGSSTLETAIVLGPSSDAAVNTVWEWGSFVDNDTVLVSERCCATNDGNSETSRMLLVDIAGRVETVVANGNLRKTHTRMSADQSGQHLLYLSGQDLMASDFGSRPAPLAAGLVGATWR